jgi:ribosome recycling factor
MADRDAGDGDLIELILDDTGEKMDKAVGHARHEFATVRTGRASSALVEKLPVDYYGSEVPLQQLANFSVPEARLLVISPYDKGSVNAIEKAIRESDLGLNPTNDGQVIRLAFPALTEERRKELVRLVRHMAEEGKVSLRNLRRTARHELEALEKDGDVRADDLKRAEKELDDMIHAHESTIATALADKEKELLDE